MEQIKCWTEFIIGYGLVMCHLKINIFTWRLIQDKLPTREQLIKRGIIVANHGGSCVFCFAVHSNFKVALVLFSQFLRSGMGCY